MEVGISGIVVVEQISLLAKVLWNDLKYIERCAFKAFQMRFSGILVGYAQPTLRYAK